MIKHSLPLAIIAAMICTHLGLAADALTPEVLASDAIVDGKGKSPGTFKTIQAALDSIPRDNRERRIIFIKNGYYPEKIRIDPACVTLHGESREKTRIAFATSSIAPQDQIVGGDIGIGDRVIIFHACVAAELPPPMFDGVPHFGGSPVADFLVHRLAGRAHHQETVHEGVVDGALQPMAFV